ncbi:MAG: GIY-YIG nuclease family protein [Hyphomicrobiaceae bacterium]|nr:GIY-YIG nuclease family protein [Hyphomicrobiaceae bacterium]
MNKVPCVYMLASRKNGTLYIGVTSDLPRRVAQHKLGELEGFSKRYRVTRLVWYEVHPTMEGAIIREKQMKKWNRAWKIREIMRGNPEWRDLSDDIS